ncbi:type IV pilus assembly protein FimV [Xylophilus sp.]|uniref:type IV pilus assembly protein FimV n=1 Tax=Xylophilus sp. TaxID=2653893 RepID=UPI002D7E8236|nr:hypothetical protein [Xylophilus sp.]
MGHEALALSLGAPRGAVTLGQPLDRLIDVQADAGEDPGTSCNRAEVALGDSRLDGARVRQIPVTDVQGRLTAVRLQTTSAVDEPVAVVRLSVGCGNRITRSYTLLAHLPETVARSSLPVAIPFAAETVQREAAAARPAASTPSSAAAPAAETAEARPATPRRPRSAAAAAPLADEQPSHAAAAPRVSVRAPAPAPAAASARPRLALDPLEDWPGTPGTLRLSDGLAKVPAEEPSARRSEAAALWKALNASPEDVLRGADRLQALEAEVRNLRAAASREKAASAELQARLEQQRSEGFGGTVVYLLGLLFALALALAGWLFARSRRDERARRNWWQFNGTGAAAEAAVPAPEPKDTTAPVPIAPAAARPATAALPAPAPAFVQGIDVDLAHVEAAASAFGHLTASPSAAASQGGRVVNPEELFDVRQHADFFVSLGQYEQAIEALQKHIAEYAESSPLAYLDLLHIFHTLSRVEDYSRLAQRFGEHFNGTVPPFAEFHRPTYGMEDYPEVLKSIERVWGTPESAVLLEAHLVRRPGAPRTAGPFALDAYRELLLLYAVVLDAGYANAQPAKPRGHAGTHLRDAIDGLTVESRMLDVEPLEPSLMLDIDPPAAPALSSPASGPDAPHGNLIDFDLDEEIEAGLARSARSKASAR